MQTDSPSTPPSTSSNGSATLSPSAMSFASTDVERGSEEDEDVEVERERGPKKRRVSESENLLRKGRYEKSTRGVSVVPGWLEGSLIFPSLKSPININPLHPATSSYNQPD